MNGSRFNRTFSLLLQHRLGKKVQVRYNDFILIVTHAGKDSPGSRVAQAIRDVQSMDYQDLEKILPLPPADSWKFASALPEVLFREMVISDHYQGQDFLQTLRSSTVSCILLLEQDQPAP